MAGIEEIEGIGPSLAAKLVAADVKTVEALLKAGGSASGRKALAATSGIDAGKLLEWVNRADLMRIKGVGSEFSDLLEAAGVDTVKELATRKPENLFAKSCTQSRSWSAVRQVPRKSRNGLRKPRLCRRPSHTNAIRTCGSQYGRRGA